MSFHVILALLGILSALYLLANVVLALIIAFMASVRKREELEYFRRPRRRPF